MPTKKLKPASMPPESIRHMRDAMKYTLLRDQAVRELEGALDMEFDECEAINTAVIDFDSAEQIEFADDQLIIATIRCLIEEN